MTKKIVPSKIIHSVSWNEDEITKYIRFDIFESTLSNLIDTINEYADLHLDQLNTEDRAYYHGFWTCAELIINEIDEFLGKGE